MTEPFPSRRYVLIATSCLLPLSGCSLLVGQPVPQLYRLTPQVGRTANGPPLRNQLVIGVPVAPQSLDTDRIALTRHQTRLDYYADSVWTDRVPVLVQGLLVEAFENTGRIAAVGRDASALTPDDLLELELRDFEARYGELRKPPTAVVCLIAKLVRLPSHHVIGTIPVMEEVPAAHRDLDSIVEAFDVAVGRALARVVNWTLLTLAHNK